MHKFYVLGIQLRFLLERATSVIDHTFRDCTPTPTQLVRRSHDGLTNRDDILNWHSSRKLPLIRACIEFNTGVAKLLARENK